MNILIVGNGFDLSHYLPTKYDHFMDVMGAIEDKNTGGLPRNLSERKIEEWLEELDKLFQKRNEVEQPSHHMNFDELFLKTRDPNFISKTKEYYLTDSILLSAQDVIKIQYRLSLNCWYQYFKNHVVEIKTWIDFEQKIEKVLMILVSCTLEIERIKRSSELFEYFDHNGKDGNRIKERDFKTLNFFNFMALEEYKVNLPVSSLYESRSYKMKKRNNLNPKFCHGKDLENGFNPSGFLDFLYQQLEEFIIIFDQYLELIVNLLQPKSQLQINAKEWLYPDKIYSFNYTNTYQRIYDNVEVDFLHGSSGENQNIILGVSDVEDGVLKKLKAYGFTKYQQKLFKDTDFLFLDKYKAKIRKDKIEIEALKMQVMMPLGERYVRSLHEVLSEKERDQFLNLNFYIWGHSLDVSDQDYIIDLFSLNDDMDRNVKVTVYYFDQNAKFALLNNLLAILGKDKVEQWIKNKWLVFNPNPEIKFNEMISEKTA